MAKENKTSFDIQELNKMYSLISHNTNEWRDKFLVEKMDPLAKIPVKGSKGAAGYDIYSFTSFKIPAKNSTIIDTKIKVKFPDGIYGRITSRSGHAFKYDLQVHPGTIDNDYTGEIKIKIFNHSSEDYISEQNGERICQLILEKFYDIPITEVTQNIDGSSGIETLVKTERGNKGFGSSGVQ